MSPVAKLRISSETAVQQRLCRGWCIINNYSIHSPVPAPETVTGLGENTSRQALRQATFLHLQQKPTGISLGTRERGAAQTPPCLAELQSRPQLHRHQLRVSWGGRVSQSTSELRQSHVPSGTGPNFLEHQLGSRLWWKKHSFYIKMPFIWACYELEYNFKKQNTNSTGGTHFWICPPNAKHLLFALLYCQKTLGKESEKQQDAR